MKTHHYKTECVYLDFEYNSTQERHLNLVSVCYLDPTTLEPKSVWLHQEQGAKIKLRAEFLKFRELGFTFVAYNAVAEASAFYSLGVDPTKCQWIDLMTEWKMLTNHNNSLADGKQLIGGKKVTTYPPLPKYEQDKEYEEQNHSKPDKGLSAAIYKLLGLSVDTERKDKVRDLIIAGTNLEEYKNEILEYGESDTIHLRELWVKMRENYKELGVKADRESLFTRGRASADVAMMTCWGYPVNRKKVERFASHVPEILKELAEDINSQFPGKNLFEWNSARQAYTFKQKPWRELISQSPFKKAWKKTEKGELSLSLEAFEDHFSFRHDYPRQNWGAQALRYLKTKQSLNGFMPKRKGETFFDALGSDSRVRSWLNPYGSQTSRFQPKATSYIPLKAAWMRALIEPPKGRAICGIDFVAEEFLISACWAKDENMYQAYKSGDPYMFLARLAGAVPQDATKKTHPLERNLFKSTVLGLSYGMSKVGLAKKLTQDTGEEVSEDKAEELIGKFNEVFSAYADKAEIEELEYIRRQGSQLSDGWCMFGDNPNKRSVRNYPIQGQGAVILRRAIREAIDNKLRVILPLHDALYLEFNPHTESKTPEFLGYIMKQAFIQSFSDKRAQEMARAIRLDYNVWGPDMPEGEWRGMKSQKIYIDERSLADYQRFNKYFN